MWGKDMAYLEGRNTEEMADRTKTSNRRETGRRGLSKAKQDSRAMARTEATRNIPSREEPRQGAQRNAAAARGHKAGAAAAVGKQWRGDEEAVPKPYRALYIGAGENDQTTGAYGRPESNRRPDDRSRGQKNGR